MLAAVGGVQRAGLRPFSPCCVFAVCWCFGLCFPLVRVAASREAHAALTEVFLESELPAGNLAFVC